MVVMKPIFGKMRVQSITQRLEGFFLEWYVENEEYILERAGYLLAVKTAVYIPKIKGDYYNVLDLPIMPYKKLKKCDMQFLILSK